MSIAAVFALVISSSAFATVAGHIFTRRLTTARAKEAGAGAAESIVSGAKDVVELLRLERSDLLARIGEVEKQRDDHRQERNVFLDRLSACEQRCDGHEARIVKLEGWIRSNTTVDPASINGH